MHATDLLVLGAGLSGGLAAACAAVRNPALRIAVLEADASPGGDHTWCFHRTDVPESAWDFLAPFVASRWDRHEVRFPSHRRALRGGYYAITADTFATALQRVLGANLRCGRRVIAADRRGATLEGGERIAARCVLDARGARELPGVTLAHQSFLGLELELEEPHTLAAPILMDATVPQLEGYRFVYVLPFTPTRLLVEDTYYLDGPRLDRAKWRARVLDYARTSGWRVACVIREEAGVLPLALDGDLSAAWPADLAPTPIGMRGLFFHPVTGYSLPDAVRTAEIVAAHAPEELPGRLRREAQTLWRARGFYRALNRALFRAPEPDQRYRILERFYTLPEALIARFYAGRTGARDAARILIGFPPAPFGKAVRALAGHA